MIKRILVAYSTRDRSYSELSDARFFEKVPYASGAVLRELSRLGWQNRRLTWEDTSNPLRLRQRMVEFAPDVVYAYGATGEVPSWARRMCSWDGPIVHSWDDYYDEIWRAAFGRFAGLFMKLYEKRIVHKSDAVVTLSRYNEARATKWGRRVYFVPNACDPIPPYDPTSSGLRLEGRLKIVYSGSQSRYKRVHELAAAMASLPRDIKLYLTGEPYEHMKQYASENVIFLGYLPRGELWSVLHQADVLASTSDQDCSLKYTEYVALGKPILACDGKARLMFDNRRNALLSMDYAASIQELAESPELRLQLAENAACDLPVRTWEDIGRQIDHVLAEVIGDYQARP